MSAAVMTKAFTPTTQQQAFIDALLTSSSHLALIARAGCGKTSTIILGVQALVAQDASLEIAVVAYNKAIADEVSGKLRQLGFDWRQVQASTLHAMGWGLVKWAFKSEIDKDKVRNIIDAIAQDHHVFRTYARQIAQLVGYAKQAAVGFFGQIGDASVWYDLADHYGIDWDLDDTTEADTIVEAAQRVYRLSLENLSVIDFDDMILIPLIKNLRVRFTKDVVFLDEAQDLSPARQALARKFVKPRTGRMVIVGDDRQAIYGFSGADADALASMVSELDATVLPLSVTWRCPKAVVAEAQRIVPDIEAAPAAPEGLVNAFHYLLKTDVPQGMPAPSFESEHGPLMPGRDAILCRNTAPLISLAYQLIRAGIPAKVEGRAIGEGLAALAKRWKVTTCSQLLDRLSNYEARETAKLQAKGKDDAIEALHDKCECLTEIIKACQQRGEQAVVDVLAAIDHLFGDDVRNAVTLATYHRAKGREWPRVILWEHAARCPSKAARQPWQRLQEHNLAYVAITRAQEVLAYVG